MTGHENDSVIMSAHLHKDKAGVVAFNIKEFSSKIEYMFFEFSSLQGAKPTKVR